MLSFPEKEPEKPKSKSKKEESESEIISHGKRKASSEDLEDMEDELEHLIRGNYGKKFSDSEGDSDDSDDSERSDSDYESDEETYSQMKKTAAAKQKNKAKSKDKDDDIEIVPAEKGKKVRKLDPIGLAIGQEMIKSRKRRREIEEMSYHRYLSARIYFKGLVIFFSQ